jgi:hypothetical protein
MPREIRNVAASVRAIPVYTHSGRVSVEAMQLH